jgi:hypothetical protein
VNKAAFIGGIILAVALVTTPAIQGAEMKYIAKGTFTVKMEPQGEPSAADGVTLGRMRISKVYEGDLAATAEGQMLTALTPVPESAGYVAIERITGTLHGKKGSFLLQHTGTMQRGEQSLSITIVPDSGTGELSGISLGVFRLRIDNKTHFYELEYQL